MRISKIFFKSSSSSSSSLSLSSSFQPRKEFKIEQKGVTQWFPGHMRKGLSDIGKVLRRTNLILEVHDARIPFSGRNLNLIKKFQSNKPIILLLNKSDLIPNEYQDKIKYNLLNQMNNNDIFLEDIFFIDSIKRNPRQAGYNNKLLSTIIDSIEKQPNLIDESDFSNLEPSYNLLVLGIPNVGKSTVINRLRNVYLNKSGKATIVGPKAGVTRSVLERIKICEYPKRLYLFDSPGILEPSFNRFKTNNNDNNQEIFMRCALCGTLSDDVVGKELIADYLLYWMNNNYHFDYVDFLGLPSPNDNITEVLTYGAIKFNLFNKIKNLETGQFEMKPNLLDVSEKFILAFRKGKFGPILLDKEILQS